MLVAAGQVDGRPWELATLVDPKRPGAVPSCLRLTYAGETTGPECANGRAVLAGQSFVLGQLGIGIDPPEVRSRTGSDFEPFLAAVFDYGEDPVLHAYLAPLPAGACLVDVDRGTDPFGGAPPLNLLPGDPGAEECSRG